MCHNCFIAQCLSEVSCYPCNAVKACCFFPIVQTPPPHLPYLCVCVCLCVSSGTDWLCLTLSNKAKHTSGGNRQAESATVHKQAVSILSRNFLWSVISWYRNTHKTHLGGEDRDSQKASAAAGCLAPALMVCMSSSGIRLQPQQGGNNADYQGNAWNASRLPKLLD